MSWLKGISLHTGSGAQKAVLALSACAVAGVAAVQLKRALQHWRAEHLMFDFPIDEQLFIGWGGSLPDGIK